MINDEISYLRVYNIQNDCMNNLSSCRRRAFLFLWVLEERSEISSSVTLPAACPCHSLIGMCVDEKATAYCRILFVLFCFLSVLGQSNDNYTTQHDFLFVSGWPQSGTSFTHHILSAATKDISTMKEKCLALFKKGCRYVSHISSDCIYVMILRCIVLPP